MRRMLVAVVTAWLVACCLFAQAAYAQDITVCPPASSGAGCGSYPTIQEAINAALPNSVISIPAGTRTEAGIVIQNKDLTLRGAAPQATTIQAASSPCALPKRVFQIEAARVTIEDMTIQNGCVLSPTLPAAGGGIWSSGSLTLRHVIVRDNTVAYGEKAPITGTVAAPWATMGGGIYSVGSLEIDSSTILTNSVVSTASRAQGGGVFNNGRAHIVNSTISGNKVWGQGGPGEQLVGGGVYNAGSLVLEYNTVVENAAQTAGGGLYSTGEVELINNLFYANSSPGGEAACSQPVAQLRAAQTGPDCDIPVLGAVDLGSLITETVKVPVYVPGKDSASIDAGKCGLSKVRSDQRGDMRGQGAECDLGSIERGFAFAPFIKTVLPAPDLIVSNVTIEPSGPLNASTQVTIKVEIQNIGNKATMESFFIDLFINPRDTPPNHGGTSWLDLCAHAPECKGDKGIIWEAPPSLQPGQRFTFTSNIDVDEWVVLKSSRWDKLFAPGLTRLWVIVDSFEVNHNPNGIIVEHREDNNRWEVPAFTVAPPVVPVAASSDADGGPAAPLAALP